MKKNIENGMIKEKKRREFLMVEIYPCGRFTYGSVLLEGLTTLDKTVQEKLLKTNLTVLSNIIERAIINNVDFFLCRR